MRFDKIKIKILLMALFALLCSSAAIAQGLNYISVTIVDEEGYPLKGVEIQLKDYKIMSDDKGVFTAPHEMDVLVGKKGYRTKKVHIKSGDIVVLEKDFIHENSHIPYGLSETFGTTSSVSTIYSSDINDSYVTNVASLLSGKLPGLILLRNGAEPGAGFPTMYIRGTGSWNTSQPMVYVDGFEMPLDNISVSEIRSISVLKDAAALATFGIKGANGVIWIETNRGENVKSKVRVNFHQGFQTPAELRTRIDSYTYASLYNEAISNDMGRWYPYYSYGKLSLYKNGNDGTIDNYDQLYPNVDWQDLILKKFAPTTNVDLSFTGGNKYLKYYALLGYQNVDGLYRGTDSKKDLNSNVNFQKFNYRLNLDIDLGKIFDLALTLGGSIADKYAPNVSSSDLWTSMHYYPANAFPAKTPHGYGGSTLYPTNPLAELYDKGYAHYHYRDIQATLNFSQNLDFITKGLRLSETVSLYNKQIQEYVKTKTYQRFRPYTNSEGIVQYSTIGTQDTDFSISDSGNSRNNLANRFNTEVSLSYKRDFGLHSVSGILVYHNDKYTIKGNREPVVTRGFAGRLDYDYDDRYFVEIGYAVNGMSRYNPKHNIGFFPSLSAAWVMTNENFAKNCSRVDFAKIRASVGLLGMYDFSSADNYYMYKQYYRETTLAPKFGYDGIDSAKGLYEYYLANPAAEWEKLLRTNVGFDVRLLAGSLELSGDFFYDYRYDILTGAKIPSCYGISYDKNINDGKSINWGTELSCSWTENIGDFKYSVTPTFSFSRNRILNMNEAPTAYPYQIRAGHSIGTPKILKADGFYYDYAEINNPAMPKSQFGAVVPGDLKYIDKSNDGYIDSNDMYYDSDYYGNVPEIVYGLNIRLEYMNFDFALNGYGMANRTVSVKNSLNVAFQDGKGNVSEMSLKRWAYYPEQGVDTRLTAEYPRLTVGSNEHNLKASDFWLVDGSMFRINEITLGYTLPRKISSYVKIDKMRIYFSATDVFSFDKFPYSDIEYQTGYPFMRTFKIGLNLNF